jgi:hypothetical protein
MLEKKSEMRVNKGEIEEERERITSLGVARKKFKSL